MSISVIFSEREVCIVYSKFSALFSVSSETLNDQPENVYTDFVAIQRFLIIVIEQCKNCIKMHLYFISK